MIRSASPQETCQNLTDRQTDVLLRFLWEAKLEVLVCNKLKSQLKSRYNFRTPVSMKLCCKYIILRAQCIPRLIMYIHREYHCIPHLKSSDSANVGAKSSLYVGKVLSQFNNSATRCTVPHIVNIESPDQ